MTSARRWILGVCTLAASASPSSAQQTSLDSTFRWSAPVAPTAHIVVRSLAGKVRVESGDVHEVRVSAMKRWRTSDPGAVSVRVSRIGPGGHDVLVCGIWRGATLDCSATGYVVNNDGRNDTRLDLVVTVPREARVSAESINDEVHIAHGAGDVSGSTVNGRVVVAVRKNADADVVLSTLNGRFTSDTGLGPGSRRMGHPPRRFTLGTGGRTIRLSSVNGELRLERASVRP
jgi:hypothetical protein